MAELNFIEKECFEQLFVTIPGYVLNFSTLKFQEFVYDTIQIDTQVEYPNLSKAKTLRNIISDYDNATVGKLLLGLLRYMQIKNLITDENREAFRMCTEIGNRLITSTKKVPIPNNMMQTQSINSTIDHNEYFDKLEQLTSFSDTPQARGFAFEKYLYDLFEVCGLEPRESFKIIGEQIDGSFVLRDAFYLLEAKWTSKKTDKADLVTFNEKVSSKSGFTRGLYISFAGYSDEALATFAIGRKINIILMTVQDLEIILTQKLDLTDVLWCKVRALADEGNYNKPVHEM